LQELGIARIAVCAPSARGRVERNFGAWQGRLPWEMRLRGMGDLEQAKHFRAANPWPHSTAASR
jgi:hypothetical protein